MAAENRGLSAMDQQSKSGSLLSWDPGLWKDGPFINNH